VSGLCDFPTDEGTTCCAPASAPPAAPLRPSNVPNLEQIAYRIGTFGSFRRAMLDSLAQILPGWRQAEAGQDYATMFIELWAYIADVLTFYQERIANEAFIGTATQRDSLLRLAELIDYRASPGAAANALLAFKLGKDKVATVPIGLRVSSKPSAGKPAAIFETDAAIHAIAAHNAIPFAKEADANQFVKLDPGVLALLASGPPSDSAALEALFPELTTVLSSAGTRAAGQPMALGGGGGVPPPPQVRSVTFQGLNLRLRPGDWLLIDAPNWALQQITSSAADPVSKTTTVSWLETPEYEYGASDPPVYAFRDQALPFGHDVPDQTSLAQTLIDLGYQQKSAEQARDAARAPWQKTGLTLVVASNKETRLLGGGGGGGVPVPMLPEDANDPTVLYLDRVYDGVAPSAGDSPSIVALVSPVGPFWTEITGVAKVTDVHYGLRARVTELILKDAIPTATNNDRIYAARDTTVLVRSEPLTLANKRPLPDPVGGSVLLLEGVYRQLAPGQRIIVRGKRFDTSTIDAEDGMIETVSSDDTTGTTTVALHAPLGNQYFRAGTSLLANVAPASQGEKVKDEILGSGDGSAWQTYTLRKSPLTYVQAPAQASEAAVVSTLEVIVNGVMWSERPNLLDTGPADRVYITREDAAAKTSLTFADGISGVRPATGKDNIHARYRKGLGLAGNADVDAIAQLIDSVPGIQSVSNPEPAIGGADRESEAQIRTNAPAKLRTFNRAVAIDDFAGLALSFPGVAMASAAWQRDALVTGTARRTLSQPVIRLTIGTTNGKRLDVQGDYAGRLRRYLDSRRDVNVPLVLVDYDPVYIEMEATIDVDDVYGRQATLRAAIAALNFRANPDGSPAFFAEFGFGQSVHLSSVYAALQAVPGVRAATVTTLRRSDDDPTVFRSTIPVGPSARAVIANAPGLGNLVLTLGVGGFAD
jgi:uncharacterized phage protein gp47/JayE